MTKYKLLKKINGATEGIFELDDNNRVIRDFNCPPGLQSFDPINQLINLIGIDNKEWFEEIKEPKTIYDLREGDKYYIINGNSEIIKTTAMFNHPQEKYNINCGNAFLIKQEAETELKKRKKLAGFKKYIHDNNDITAKLLLKDLKEKEYEIIDYFNRIH